MAPEPEVPQTPVEIKPSFKERMVLRSSKMSENLETKMPKAHAKGTYVFNYLSEVWQETFPSATDNVKTKITQRRERAKLIKDLQ